MAQFEIDFEDDFLSGLLESDFDDIAKEALEETIPILESSMKNAVQKSIQHSGESELIESMKASKPKKTKTDAWIATVTPKGYSTTKVYTVNGKKSKRKYKISNALKAIWKEYGIPGRQPARPFIASATNSVKHEINEKMQELYNRKVGAE